MTDPLKSPEKFTSQEAYFIEPFFTNLDKNVFAARYLPSEVLGALASRYSRSTKGVRRLFYDEYIKPIIDPDLAGADARSAREAQTMKKELTAFVTYLHEHGGWEAVVNSNRAREFFRKWLAAYGDDSIAQMAGAHLFFENISIVATKVLEDFRIGFAPLEKSTRYVLFDQKIGGRWLYYLEPDLVRSKYGREYVRLANMLFRRYSELIEPLSKYLKKKFSQELDQSDRAYRETIKAKTCDILRLFLPCSTLTNVGFFGVGQAFEYVLTKCYASPFAEIRALAKAAQVELNKVIPSLVDRASSPRGKIYQRYVATTEKTLEKMARKLGLSGWSTPGVGSRRRPEDTPVVSQISNTFEVWSGRYSVHTSKVRSGSGVELVEYDPGAEDKIVASILYKYARLPYAVLKEKVGSMTGGQKLAVIKTAIAGRQVRQHRLIRAFENTYYKFDVVANIGAYRDLHRHRMMTQERQRFGTDLGFDLPEDLVRARMTAPYIDAAQKIDRFYQKVVRDFPDQAQYIPILGHRVRWYQWQNLRELAWEAELRTGLQGHPDYRVIEQQKVEAVRKVHSTLVAALKFVDFNKYDLARRESEKRIDRKLERT